MNDKELEQKAVNDEAASFASYIAEKKFPLAKPFTMDSHELAFSCAYEGYLKALQLKQKEIASLQERIKELESDNRIRVGDYVIYRDFPNAGWSQVLSIQMDMPSIEPLAHLVDEYGNTGTEPLRRLVKSNSPHLFAKKPNNRTTEKPKFGIPTTEEKRDIGHNDPDRGGDYDR